MMQEQKTTRKQAVNALRCTKRSRSGLLWSLSGLALALLVLVVLPSAQIELGAKTLQGLVGSYTDPGPGHYWKVTYESIGTSQDDVSNGDGTATHYSSSWQDYPDETTLAFYISPGGSGLDANVSGSVTTTLTWIPANGQDATTDPPPACVVVKETASASATGGPNGGSGNQADDGLGDAQTGSGYASSSGTHYSVQDGSSGIITLVSRSLTAKTATYVPPASQGNYAGASVTYGVTPYSIYIERNGLPLTDNSNTKVLPGQLNDFTVSSDGLKQGNWSWTASGEKFSDWLFTYDNDTPPNVVKAEKKTYIYYDRPDIYFYYSKGGGDENISCSLTLGDAPNTVGVTVAGKVSVVQPSSSLSASWGDSIHFSPDALNPSAVGLYGIPDVSDGINWNYSVTVPNSLDDAAQMCIVQLTTPKRWSRSEINGQTYVITHRYNGQQGLDTVFPAHGPYDASGGPQVYGDSPFLGLTEYTHRAVTGLNLSRQSEDFELYLMFKPSGASSEWVPLRKLNWWWSVEALHPDGDAWSLTAERNLEGSSPYSIHPEWDKLITLKQTDFNVQQTSP